MVVVEAPFVSSVFQAKLGTDPAIFTAQANTATPPPLSSRPCRHYLLEAFIPFMNLVVRLVILFLGTRACLGLGGSAQQSSGRRSSCRSVKGFDRYDLQRHPTYQCRFLPLNWVTLEFRGLHVKHCRSWLRPSQPGQHCIRSFGSSQRRAVFRKGALRRCP